MMVSQNLNDGVQSLHRFMQQVQHCIASMSSSFKIEKNKSRIKNRIGSI